METIGKSEKDPGRSRGVWYDGLWYAMDDLLKESVVSANEIRIRLKEGKTIEEALFTPPVPQAERLQQKGRYFWKGEYLALTEILRRERCPISRQLVYLKMKAGKSLEEILHGQTAKSEDNQAGKS